MFNFIWIVTPLNYPHSACFNEFAMTLRDACIVLGRKCEVVTQKPADNASVLVLGANLLPPGIHLPKHYVIYQLEQVSDESGWMKDTYLHYLRNYTVWDYSPLNIELMKKWGINAVFCELGYMPCLTHIEPRTEDIDILFMGSTNDRRLAVLKQLAAKGIKVGAIFGEYGDRRTEALARSKIIINIHFYQAKIFEIFRCSYLMANKKCVVSEDGADRALEGPYYDGIAFVPYDQLVDKCVELLSNGAERKHIAQKGFDIFSKRSQVDILRKMTVPKPAAA